MQISDYLVRPHNPTSVERELARLEKFGSADAIARFFERLGVNGHVSESSACPVANYLHAMTDEQGFEVSPRMIGTFEKYYYVPRPVRDFIVNFDSGEYPLLDVDYESEYIGFDEGNSNNE